MTTTQYQDLLEHIPCNLCGNDNFDIIYPPSYNLAKPEEITEVFRSSGDDILLDQLVCCRSCKLQYLTPRLKSSIIIDGYSAGEDPLFVSQVKAREKTFLRAWQSIIGNKRPPGRLLDVGTASGAFLKVAKDHDWQIAGCEPNRWLTDWCQKQYDITVFPGTIFDMNLPDNHFDIVSLWDVLEHTTDPQAVLKECRRVLKKDGLLIVNYPDIGSLVARMMRRKWVFLLSIHLYYFTRATIKKLLTQAGFHVTNTRPHWQTLELGYIILRMKPYLPKVVNVAEKLVKKLRMENLAIPYWMGQTLVIAKKV